jgi:hypothetical protein
LRCPVMVWKLFIIWSSFFLKKCTTTIQFYLFPKNARLIVATLKCTLHNYHITFLSVQKELAEALCLHALPPMVKIAWFWCTLTLNRDWEEVTTDILLSERLALVSDNSNLTAMGK